MEAFYRLATIDYRLLAEELDWAGVFRDLRERFGSPLRLLDVACGSGQFPHALSEHAGLPTGPHWKVEYSLLDPSEFSIQTARDQLQDPFEPAEEYQCTLQQFVAPNSRFPVVWATHALYCVPQQELSRALERMSATLDPTGLGFIAHASRDSHYLRFHDLYLKHWRSDSAEPYSTGEQVIAALQTGSGNETLVYWPIDYEGTLELADRQTVERYLQRCLFDDTLSLNAMLEHEQLGSYLRECMDEPASLWRFPQQVWLIFFGDLGTQASQWRQP